jgi:N-acetylneuraminate synthase
MRTTKIIAEIGINFAYGKSTNGFLTHVCDLIDAAKVAGCDYVKFQKRTPELCVPEAEKSKPKRVPWREEETTYLQYKIDIELSNQDYYIIDRYCQTRGIKWFASVWDKSAVDFMKRWKEEGFAYANIMKIPSALITDLDLCNYARENSDTLIISTGMSDESEISKCIESCNPDVVMHTNSTYPSPVDELNLEYITWLKDGLTAEKEVGYSGHEFGLITTMAAVCLGANWVERHVTLDRTLWGSDQMASVEPQGLMKLVKGIRDIEKSMGGYGPRTVIGSELNKRKSLRGV